MTKGYNVLKRQLTVNEKQLIGLYKQSLKEIKRELGLLYERMGSTPSLSQASKYNRLQNMSRGLQDQLVSLATKSKSVIKDGIKTAYTETYNITGWATESSMGIDAGFAPMPQDLEASKKVLEGVVEEKIRNSAGRVVGVVRKDPFELIKWDKSVKGVAEKFNKSIKQEIVKGLARGDGYGTVAKRLGQLGGKNASQMFRIIQTETGRASSQGYLKAFDEISNSSIFITDESQGEGLLISSKWIATLDSKTRDRHQALDNQIAEPLENNGTPMFTISGMTAPAPRLFGVAEMDINCRCGTSPYIEGFEDIDVRRARDESGKSVIVKNQSYKDWAKSKGIKTKTNVPTPKKPKFTPAKSIKEAEERIRKQGVKNVNLKGAKPDAYNGVLSAVESEGGIKTLGLDKIETYRRASSTSAAVYSPSNNSISINLSKGKSFGHKITSYETQLSKTKKSLAEWEKYKKTVTNKAQIKQARGMVNRLDSRVRQLEWDIKQGLKAKPHTVASMNKNEFDYWLDTVRHEIGHKRHDVGKNIFFNKDIKKALTEYARVNDKEYFAEMYAWFRRYGSSDIPENMLKIFESL